MGGKTRRRLRDGLRLLELADERADADAREQGLGLERQAGLRRGGVVLEPLGDGGALVSEAVGLPRARSEVSQR